MKNTLIELNTNQVDSIAGGIPVGALPLVVFSEGFLNFH